MEPIITADYAVHFSETAFDAINTHLADHSYSKVFVLVDENTHACCLPYFMSQLQGDYPFEIIEIEAGEIHKTLETCSQVWLAMSELDGDRKSLMINLGGGVVTDMGGFLASCFKRGINFINVPTTLLSMVDASVGGKTGVDLGPLKNQIGVINQPEMVLIDPVFLKTLDERQLWSGFSEMLKHGLIQNRAYWDELRAKESLTEIAQYIHTSVHIKNEVVLQDPTEQNLRKILNYGHTLGHAIESYFLASETHETLLHGEAIAIGMIMEGFLSNALTGLGAEDLDNITQTFLAHYPRVSFAPDDIKAILDLLKFDKKNSHGEINFVLLEDIGKAVYDITIPHKLLEDAFAYYNSKIN